MCPKVLSPSENLRHVEEGLKADPVESDHMVMA